MIEFNLAQSVLFLYLKEDFDVSIDRVEKGAFDNDRYYKNTME